MNTAELDLLHAASQGDEDKVSLLIMGDSIDIDCRCAKEELTPLHLASSFGHIQVAELLLARGASVHTKSSTGCTPLHEAARYGNFDSMKLLLQNGAIVNVKDHEGNKPEDLARIFGQTEIHKYLIDNKSYFEEKDKVTIMVVEEQAELQCKKLKYELSSTKSELNKYKTLWEKAQASENKTAMIEANLIAELNKVKFEMNNYKSLLERAKAAAEYVSKTQSPKAEPAIPSASSLSRSYRGGTQTLSTIHETSYPTNADSNSNYNILVQHARIAAEEARNAEQHSRYTLNESYTKARQAINTNKSNVHDNSNDVLQQVLKEMSAMKKEFERIASSSNSNFSQQQQSSASRRSSSTSVSPSYNKNNKNRNKTRNLDHYLEDSSNNIPSTTQMKDMLKDQVKEVIEDQLNELLMNSPTNIVMKGVSKKNFQSNRWYNVSSDGTIV